MSPLFGGKQAAMKKEAQRRNNAQLPTARIPFAQFAPHYSELQNTIISGGNQDNRAVMERYVINHALARHLPIIVLHCNNPFMATVQGTHALLAGAEIGLDPFIHTDRVDIVDLLTDLGKTVLQHDNKMFALWQLVLDIMALEQPETDMANLVAFPYNRIPEKLEELAAGGRIDAGRQMELSNRYGAVADLAYAAEQLIVKLKPFFESVRGHDRRMNLRELMAANGAAFINLVSDTNVIAKELIFAVIDRLMQHGTRFLLVTDGISLPQITGGGKGHMHKVLFSNNGNIALTMGAGDIAAMVQSNDDYFGTLTGNNANVIVLRHSSTISAEKWSVFFGEYYHMREDNTFATSKNNTAFITRNNTSGVTIQEELRKKISKEKIAALPEGCAYVHAARGNFFKVILGSVVA